jgi:hypothetical protein
VRDIFANPERTRQKIANAIQTAKDNDRESILGETFEFYDRMYEDFHQRQELFDYKDKPDFDFAKEIADYLE